MPQQLQQLSQQITALTGRVSAVEGHKHLGTDSLRVDYTDLINRSRHILYRIVAPTVANTVAVLGGSLVMPFGGYISVAGATVDTAGTTGTETIDVLKNGTTIMANTKITIATGNTSSRSSAPSVISAAAFAVGDIFTFSVTAIHSTAALGLTIFMRAVETTT